LGCLWYSCWAPRPLQRTAQTWSTHVYTSTNSVLHLHSYMEVVSELQDSVDITLSHSQQHAALRWHGSNSQLTATATEGLVEAGQEASNWEGRVGDWVLACLQEVWSGRMRTQRSRTKGEGIIQRSEWLCPKPACQDLETVTTKYAHLYTKSEPMGCPVAPSPTPLKGSKTTTHMEKIVRVCPLLPDLQMPSNETL
jgi:hypothetical protein